MSDTHVSFLSDEIRKLEELIAALEKENKLLWEMNNFMRDLAYQHGWLKERERRNK